MNTESQNQVALPEDFAQRVLHEVDRRHVRARRMRGLGAGLAVAMALVVAGRIPFRLARGLARHAQPAVAVGLAVADPEDPLIDDADLDPGSYFLAETAAESPAPDSEDADDGDLFGQE